MRKLKPIIRQLDFRQSEDTLEQNVAKADKAIEENAYDFSNYTKQVYTQNGKKRLIYSFDTLSMENILCHYLKREIDKLFHVKYASRSKIMNLFFNTLPVIKDMKDFVIIRADFKDFFNSVLTGHVYEKYIRNSILRRSDKDILEQYVHEFKYCYAGLCLSNELAEIVCRDFDRLIRAKLERYGIFFYERYVDDMLIMLKSYIDQDTFLTIIGSAIKEVFGKCPVSLNKDNEKFSFITCRELQAEALSAGAASKSIIFLGYEFYLNYSNQNKITFKYGISQKKRDRYRHIIETAFIQYRRTGDVELLRQRLKLFSSRIVISRSLGNNRVEWLTNGITSNYVELRYHLKDLDIKTEMYLKNLFTDILRQYGLDIPYFMQPYNDNENTIYNLYSNLMRNRSIIFEKKIGVQRSILVKWIHKIAPNYIESGKSYYRIVMEYFELFKYEQCQLLGEGTAQKQCRLLISIEITDYPDPLMCATIGHGCDEQGCSLFSMHHLGECVNGFK